MGQAGVLYCYFEDADARFEGGGNRWLGFLYLCMTCFKGNVVDFERVNLLFCIDCMICGRRGGGYLIFVVSRKRTIVDFSDITMYLRDSSHMCLVCNVIVNLIHTLSMIVMLMCRLV